MPPRLGPLLLAVVAACGLLLLGEGAFARNINQTPIEVTIRVLPYASFSSPSGGDFKLMVPPLACPPVPRLLPLLLRRLWALNCQLVPGWYPWPPIKPARLPFRVEGNATVQVSAVPGAFVRSYFGRYLGRASQGTAAALGYHAIVHFPTPSPSYEWTQEWGGWDEWHHWQDWPGFGSLPVWSGISHLPGTDGGAAPLLAANLAEQQFSANGVIYAVARRTWTTTGAYAEPGAYYGSIIITVTAE